MFKQLIAHVETAVVSASGLGALADRLGSKLLPSSVAEAASTSSCTAVSCSCQYWGTNCSMLLWCWGGTGYVCGDYCGVCEDIP